MRSAWSHLANISFARAAAPASANTPSARAKDRKRGTPFYENHNLVSAVRAGKPPLAIAKIAVKVAEQHGEDSEPDMAFGDLELMLSSALELLTPEQRSKWADAVKAELDIDDEV